MWVAIFEHNPLGPQETSRNMGGGALAAYVFLKNVGQSTQTNTMEPEAKAQSKHGPTEQNGMTAGDEVSRRGALEERLAGETHLRRFTEDVLDSRQQEIESKETETNQLLAKVEILKKELADTQRQLADARSQTKNKTKQLQDARDQIFHLQPSRKDITEAEAKEAYKNLCGNVQRWVENRVADVIDDLESGRLKAAPPAASRFVTLLREQSRRNLNADQSDEYHIMGVIMNYLYVALFSKSFYCPLTDTEEDGTLVWIDELENTLSRLPRDVAHCRQWRTETLTALVHQPIFKSRRARYLSRVTDDMTSLLSVVAPRTPSAELHSSIRRSIVEPAADLVHQLHLASSIFSLKWPARTAASRLEVYQCLNLASGGMVLDMAGTKENSPARRNVSYLFDVAPGLFVERIEGGKKLALKAIAKPTVLVNDRGGEVPQNPTVMRWLWDNASTSQGPGRGVSRTWGGRSKPTHVRYLSKL
ncbi:hypothetical protein FZEAL_483 [Fusarium zealandicum]|uniref:Uncharacterized protein n=1 Tax=Fusarium zealandicum TaxID=1053134 RepID=A0A8H4XQU0_9HYPO|nr:hypothetical protein FZEAL_483 [Fusarium zealandicum]